MARVKTREAAARALGVSGETVRKWAYQPWWKPEFHDSAGYDVEAIKAANPRFGREDDQRDDLDKARQMTMLSRQIELQILKSKLDERNRKLLPVDRLIEITRLHDKALVNSLTQLPTQLSKLANDAKTKKRLHDEGQNIVRRVLRNHSQDVSTSLQRFIDA